MIEMKRQYLEASYREAQENTGEVEALRKSTVLCDQALECHKRVWKQAITIFGLHDKKEDSQTSSMNMKLVT